MPAGVCPWWMGYLLATPLRRLLHAPARILAPHLRAGMTVLEPGPAMGFFTLELARRIQPGGRVVAVDVEPRMLAGLARRARKADLLGFIDLRQARGGSMGVEDLAGTVDFVLAFAVVHEMPASQAFFAEAFAALASGGRLLLAEPSLHVSAARFTEELAEASGAGFQLEDRPSIRQCRAALLVKP